MVDKVCVMERQRQTIGEAGDEGPPSMEFCIADANVVIIVAGGGGGGLRERQGG